MSVAPHSTTALRRVGAGVLATIASLAAVATVVCALVWLWAAAVGAFAVLAAATTGFWSVLEHGPHGARRTVA